jgi:Domain of unknown function (DUF397)
MDLTGVSWRKSSYSAGNGGDCVEVAEVWRKSFYSGTNGGACVEAARTLPAAIAVRDSKDPAGPKLIFTPADWAAFTTAIRASA